MALEPAGPSSIPNPTVGGDPHAARDIARERTVAQPDQRDVLGDGARREVGATAVGHLLDQDHRILDPQAVPDR